MFQPQIRQSLVFKTIAMVLLVCVFSTTTLTAPGFAQVSPPTILNLPIPGTPLSPSAAFIPPTIKGMTLDPQNPLKFDFIINEGDERLAPEELRAQSMKLVKYFLASLTTPEDEMWVNLSPYEKERIIPEAFGTTDMGRDLLAQDYLLKQLSASLHNPQEELGKKFWKRVRAKAYEQFGTADIPTNSFNKIWIVPEKAVVYEQGQSAFVVQSHLKVMMEEDYLALSHVTRDEGRGTTDESSIVHRPSSFVANDIIREIILPEIEREVNEGQTFANLRQIYHAMILAVWFKEKMKNGLLDQLYVDQNKTQGIETEDKKIKEKIYQQYLDAFKIGVYNFIQEDYDPVSKEIIPRQYFSGGFEGRDLAMTIETIDGNDPGALSDQQLRTVASGIPRSHNHQVGITLIENLPESLGDAAMTGETTGLGAENAERAKNRRLILEPKIRALVNYPSMDTLRILMEYQKEEKDILLQPVIMDTLISVLEKVGTYATYTITQGIVVQEAIDADKIKAVKSLAERKDKESILEVFDIIDNAPDNTPLMNQAITALNNQSSGFGRRIFLDTILEMAQQANRTKGKYDIVQTPLRRAATLSRLFAKDILIKEEHNQRLDSFKLRFFLYLERQIALLTAQNGGINPVRELISSSTGNHGIAMVDIAKQLGLEAVVFVSRSVSNAKRQEIISRGGRVVDRSDKGVPFANFDDAKAAARAYHQSQGTRTIMVPHASPSVSAGYSTVELEILDQLREMGRDKKRTVILFPAGAGGLVIGSALVNIAQGHEHIKVIGVGTERFNSLELSLLAGYPMITREGDSSGYIDEDGIAVPRVDPFALAMIKLLSQYKNNFELISAEHRHIPQTTNLIFRDTQPIFPEGSSGMLIAAMLKHPQIIAQAEQVILVSTGKRLPEEERVRMYDPDEAKLYRDISAMANDALVKSRALEIASMTDTRTETADLAMFSKELSLDLHNSFLIGERTFRIEEINQGEGTATIKETLDGPGVPFQLKLNANAYQITDPSATISLRRIHTSQKINLTVESMQNIVATTSTMRTIAYNHRLVQIELLLGNLLWVKSEDKMWDIPKTKRHALDGFGSRFFAAQRQKTWSALIEYLNALAWATDIELNAPQQPSSFTPGMLLYERYSHTLLKTTPDDDLKSLMTVSISNLIKMIRQNEAQERLSDAAMSASRRMPVMMPDNVKKPVLDFLQNADELEMMLAGGSDYFYQLISQIQISDSDSESTIFSKLYRVVESRYDAGSKKARYLERFGLRAFESNWGHHLQYFMSHIDKLVIYSPEHKEAAFQHLKNADSDELKRLIQGIMRGNDTQVERLARNLQKYLKNELRPPLNLLDIHQNVYGFGSRKSFSAFAKNLLEVVGQKDGLRPTAASTDNAMTTHPSNLRKAFKFRINYMVNLPKRLHVLELTDVKSQNTREVVYPGYFVHANLEGDEPLREFYDQFIVHSRSVAEIQDKLTKNRIPLLVYYTENFPGDGEDKELIMIPVALVFYDKIEDRDDMIVIPLTTDDDLVNTWLLDLSHLRNSELDYVKFVPDELVEIEFFDITLEHQPIGTFEMLDLLTNLYERDFPRLTGYTTLAVTYEAAADQAMIGDFEQTLMKGDMEEALKLFAEMSPTEDAKDLEPEEAMILHILRTSISDEARKKMDVTELKRIIRLVSVTDSLDWLKERLQKKEGISLVDNVMLWITKNVELEEKITFGYLAEIMGDTASSAQNRYISSLAEDVYLDHFIQDEIKLAQKINAQLTRRPLERGPTVLTADDTRFRKMVRFFLSAADRMGIKIQFRQKRVVSEELISIEEELPKVNQNLTDFLARIHQTLITMRDFLREEYADEDAPREVRQNAQHEFDQLIRLHKRISHELKHLKSSGYHRGIHLVTAPDPTADDKAMLARQIIEAASVLRLTPVSVKGAINEDVNSSRESNAFYKNEFEMILMDEGVTKDQADIVLEKTLFKGNYFFPFDFDSRSLSDFLKTKLKLSDQKIETIITKIEEVLLKNIQPTRFIQALVIARYLLSNEISQIPGEEPLAEITSKEVVDLLKEHKLFLPVVERLKPADQAMVGNSLLMVDNIKALILDWDGTLVNTVPFVVPLIAVAIARLNGQEIHSLDELSAPQIDEAAEWELKHRGRTFKEEFSAILAHQFSTMPTEEIQRKAQEMTDQYIKDFVHFYGDQIRQDPQQLLLPGAAEWLKRLRAQFPDLTIILVSGSPLSLINEQLSLLGLDQYFNEIIGGEIKTEVFPMLREKYGFNDNDALIVGDGEGEMLAGKLIKQQLLGVVEGVENRAKLKAAGATHIVRSINDIELTEGSLPKTVKIYLPGGSDQAMTPFEMEKMIERKAIKFLKEADAVDFIVFGFDINSTAYALITILQEEGAAFHDWGSFFVAMEKAIPKLPYYTASTSSVDSFFTRAGNMILDRLTQGHERLKVYDPKLKTFALEWLKKASRRDISDALLAADLNMQAANVDNLYYGRAELTSLLDIHRNFRGFKTINFRPFLKALLAHVEPMMPQEEGGDGAMVGGEPYALSQRPGGIDMNPEFMDLQIKRDETGMPLPLELQPIDSMRIDGFTPIIINIVPIVNLPLLLGLDIDGEKTSEFGLRPESKAKEPERLSFVARRSLLVA